MLGQQHPFSPSVPAEAGCLFTVAADVHVFISGDSVEELSGGTSRQCRGAVREALGQCSGAVWH